MTTKISSETESTWGYRVVRHRDEKGNEYYQIHEVFYQGETPISITEEPIAPLGEKIEDLWAELEMMHDDAVAGYPILEMADFEEGGKYHNTYWKDLLGDAENTMVPFTEQDLKDWGLSENGDEESLDEQQ